MASPCNYLAYPELDWNLGFPRLEPVSTIFYARARCSYCAPINLQSTNLHNVGLELRVGSSSLSKFVLVLSINARACTPCPPQTFEFVSKKLTFFCCTLLVCLCETMFLLFFQSYYDFAIPKTIIKVWLGQTGVIINFLIEQKVKLLSCHSVRDVCAQFVFLFASLTILSLRLSSLSQRNRPLSFFHLLQNTS